MLLRVWRFVTLLLTAISMAIAFSHLIRVAKHQSEKTHITEKPILDVLVTAVA